LRQESGALWYDLSEESAQNCVIGEIGQFLEL
jgi:hypothetical protein